MNKNKTKKKNTSRQLVRKVNPQWGPPPFHDVLTIRQTLRFQAIAAATTTFTARNLLDLVLLAQTAIVGARVMNAVKLHKVSLWCPMTSSLVPVTAIISFLYGATSSTGTAGGSDYSISDTSMGSDKPAFVSAKPPRNSASAFWADGLSAGNLFSLTVVAASIIDIDITFRIQDSSTVIPLQFPTLVTATTGAVYIGGLDGIRVAGTNYPPVAFQTT